METILLSGTKLKNQIIDKLKIKARTLIDKGKKPHLVVVQVGNNPASKIYIGHKEKTCKKVGIDFTWKKFEESITYEEFKKEIIKLNNDTNVSAMIIQMPLPKHLSEKSVINLIDPKKDADGLHPLNQGIHFTSSKEYAPFPCTPKGIMTLLKEYKIDPKGKNVAILGRSLIVGKPMGLLMMNANGTVTTLHTRTKPEDFKRAINNADIIVSSTGVKDPFTAEDVKEGVVIIDVGMVRDEEGKLRGDIAYKNFIGKASYITPVPGGVGPMTVISLIETTIELEEKNAM